MTRRTDAGKRRPRPALSIVQPGGGRREQQPNYDRVFAKVEARLNDLLGWVSQQSQLAMELAETVLQLPARPREKKVRELARVEPWSVASALVGGARQRLTGEPAQASSLAELAVAAAEEMDTASHPPLLKAGLLINAYLLLAASRHRAGQIEAAEEALEKAETCLAEASPGGPRSRFLWLLRQFRRVQLSFDRTQQSFDSIIALLEERLEAFDV